MGRSNLIDERSIDQSHAASVANTASRSKLHRQMAHQLTNMNAEKDDLQNQLTSMTEQNESLQGQLTESTSEKDSLQTQLTDVTAEKDDLQGQLKNASASKEGQNALYARMPATRWPRECPPDGREILSWMTPATKRSYSIHAHH